jgi:hypothetical protein
MFRNPFPGGAGANNPPASPSSRAYGGRTGPELAG